MIARSWPGWFTSLYGGQWPRRYITGDTETTGFKKDLDVIVGIAHVLVEDGKPSSRLSLLLDWSNHPVVPEHYVKRRLLEVRDAMARDGRHWGITWERLVSEGIKPEKAMAFYSELFGDWASSGGFFAFHNGFFDEEMLSHNFAGFGIDPKGFSFPENQYFDTSGMERAVQIGHPEAMPRQGETLKAYFRRMRYARGSTLHSSLDKHCAAKYGWADRHGLDMRQAHDAGFDSYLVHLLMEEYRGMLSGPEAATPHTFAEVPALLKDLPKRSDVVPAASWQPHQIKRRKGQRNR